MTERKGIILAGGSGTRLYPVTIGVSKQLLPVFDKPMIYYPLTVLMMAGMREIAVITTPKDREQYERTLGDGTQWGVRLAYIEQPRPEGLAQAYLLAEGFLDGAASAMVLGDNIFHGHGLQGLLAQAHAKESGASVFGYHVADPERYGVVDFAEDGTTVRGIVEKPKVAPSSHAVVGLYFMDGTAPRRAREVEPSERGELEITSLLEGYLADGDLSLIRLGRGYAWFDTGTHESLLTAGRYVQALTERQGQQVGSPEEVAFRMGWIDAARLLERAKLFAKNDYGQYLENLVDDVEAGG